ncbi:hypothetical protein OESDEN_19554 [Oesophagostomum dentatum]|uniref:non-specific serine/threonine protein kinase n=1 Tax=Oesophagostomum dentatum TaxID=61180 RepID=A0A0B1SB46_OESDE|nr:hypothetical protein OESDEN_19554 [Oesophagostomum dentatum]
MTVIRTITADGDKPHIPLVFHAAKHKRFCYMIMTLLGENLKELKVSFDLRTFRIFQPQLRPRATRTRCGRGAAIFYSAVKLNFSVKLVHDYGFVHRDIKPNNFVMGYRDDYDRARLVHILDFGLSRSYAVQNVSNTSRTLPYLRSSWST